jgi:DNA-binding protein HU-beta
MTRADLVASMAAESGWTKAASDRALRALLGSIRTSLKRGQPVTLVGFGTFSVGRRKARRGKNPRTGQPMNVAGGRTPRFKPSPELKRAIQ